MMAAIISRQVSAHSSRVPMISVTQRFVLNNLQKSLNLAVGMSGGSTGEANNQLLEALNSPVIKAIQDVESEAPGHGDAALALVNGKTDDNEDDKSEKKPEEKPDKKPDSKIPDATLDSSSSSLSVSSSSDDRHFGVS